MRRDQSDVTLTSLLPQGGKKLHQEIHTQTHKAERKQKKRGTVHTEKLPLLPAQRDCGLHEQRECL